MNYLRNNDTGATYTFDSAPMGGSMGGGQNALMPDYSAPIDVYGQQMAMNGVKPIHMTSGMDTSQLYLPQLY